MAKFRFQFAILVILASPLLTGASDCASSHEPRDGGSGGDGDGDGDGDGHGDLDGGSTQACAPSDCEGQPIPEIGCADGQPIVLCERRDDGSCHVRVTCPGGTCGGFAGVSCEPGLFCNFEVAAGGDGCNVADGQGVCQQLPTLCPGDYSPVCGCDLHSYTNACDAHSRGTSVLHEGNCSYDECRSIGGRPVTSLGANVPMCEPGEDGYALDGIEGAVCCLPGSSR